MTILNEPVEIADAEEATGIAMDVAGCDREPIHVPGSIQPHGLLLVVDATDFAVIAGAGAIDQRWRADWANQPLAELIPDAPQKLREARRDEILLGTAQRIGMDAVAVRGDGIWLIQLEESETPRAAADLVGWIDDVGSQFERASGLIELCERAAEVFHELTGFDRVMIYRFLDDDSGVVVAEHVVENLGTYHNHHFPASDIPRQARELYMRNRVRVIPTIEYEPAPIRPANYSHIDLSDIALRSVSPIHLQYLRNMGVAASASVSIVKDGVLWGLVACHHMTPRSLGYSERRAARLIAAGLSRQIRAKEEAETYRERIRVRANEDAILARVDGDVDPEEMFEHAGGDLRRMFDADGFAILHGNALHLAGACPDRDDVREVAGWVRTTDAGPFHSSNLGAMFPSARHYQERASGLLAVTLSSHIPTVLMWFRAEHRELVEWAGNPHKGRDLQPGEALSPRKSFETWTEEVRGRARRWTAPEIEGAHRLSRLLFEARQNRRVRDLARDLGVAVADKDRLIAQKDTLLKEVNHRVQNSLQLVVAFLAMQARAGEDETLTRHLTEAQRRLSAVALVHRRLYADDNVETVDLARYLEELVDDLMSSMGEEWAGRLTLDLAPILIPADAAVQVGLILVELVINAQKYAYSGEAGPITIALEQHRARFRLIVADRGVGRTGTRKGFGTRMLNAMVDRLQGIIEDEDNRPGLRIIVSAPLDQQRIEIGTEYGRRVH